MESQRSTVSDALNSFALSKKAHTVEFLKSPAILSCMCEKANGSK